MKTGLDKEPFKNTTAKQVQEQVEKMNAQVTDRFLPPLLPPSLLAS